jgi:hypothetical protein
MMTFEEFQSGQKFLMTRFDMSNEEFFEVMGRREQSPSFDGVEFEAYFRMELYRNGNYNDRIVHSSIFLRNVALASGNPTITAEEEMKNAVDELIKRIDALKIDISGSAPVQLSFEEQIFNIATTSPGFSLTSRSGLLTAIKE